MQGSGMWGLGRLWRGWCVGGTLSASPVASQGMKADISSTLGMVSSMVSRQAKAALRSGSPSSTVCVKGPRFTLRSSVSAVDFLSSGTYTRETEAELGQITLGWFREDTIMVMKVMEMI